jgi:hypothetical protein
MVSKSKELKSLTFPDDKADIINQIKDISDVIKNISDMNKTLFSIIDKENIQNIVNKLN